jgi:hypothetical protein
MAQHPVEMILIRQLAGYLSVPVLVMDEAGIVISPGRLSLRRPG